MNDCLVTWRKTCLNIVGGEERKRNLLTKKNLCCAKRTVILLVVWDRFSPSQIGRKWNRAPIYYYQTGLKLSTSNFRLRGWCCCHCRGMSCSTRLISARCVSSMLFMSKSLSVAGTSSMVSSDQIFVVHVGQHVFVVGIVDGFIDGFVDGFVDGIVDGIPLDNVSFCIVVDVKANKVVKVVKLLWDGLSAFLAPPLPSSWPPLPSSWLPLPSWPLFLLLGLFFLLLSLFFTFLSCRCFYDFQFVKFFFSTITPRHHSASLSFDTVWSRIAWKFWISPLSSWVMDFGLVRCWGYYHIALFSVLVNYLKYVSWWFQYLVEWVM